ncbi:MAG: hypothetical protein ACI4L6_03950 [Candidatus Onthoplasma sp.]
MKKLLLTIGVMIIFLLSSHNTNNFSLLDYFDGEYYSFSSCQTENSVDLGFAYMSNVEIERDKLSGESVKLKNFEPSEAIKKLKARVVYTEYLESGTTVIYAYTNLISKKVKVKDENVNVQIAINDEFCIVGWPLIMGSF